MPAHYRLNKKVRDIGSFFSLAGLIGGVFLCRYLITDSGLIAPEKIYFWLYVLSAGAGGLGGLLFGVNVSFYFTEGKEFDIDRVFGILARILGAIGALGGVVLTFFLGPIIIDPYRLYLTKDVINIIYILLAVNLAGLGLIAGLYIGEFVQLVLFIVIGLVVFVVIQLNNFGLLGPALEWIRAIGA